VGSGCFIARCGGFKASSAISSGLPVNLHIHDLVAVEAEQQLDDGA
jgi:hypothetical protein